MKNKNKEEYYKVKIIIIGNSGVGKTNIFYRFINGEFTNDIENTMCIDFRYYNIKIENKIFSLQLWDTAGSEEYKSITKSYYSNAACCIFAYSISDEDSFKSINEWFENFKNFSNPNIVLILVGNKNDLNDMRIIDEEKGKVLASQFGMEFFECSAKTGYNINEIFKKACERINENINNNLYDFENGENCVKKINLVNEDLKPNKIFSLEEVNDKEYKSNKNNKSNKSNKSKKKKKSC